MIMLNFKFSSHTLYNIDLFVVNMSAEAQCTIYMINEINRVEFLFNNYYTDFGEETNAEVNIDVNLIMYCTY